MPKQRIPRAVPFLVLFVFLCLVCSAHGQTQIQATTPPLTIDDALRLANLQASTYQGAILNERIAAEDVKQARAAFLPKLSAPLAYIYTSPAQGLPPGEPRAPSFIAADAIGAYEAFASVSGDCTICMVVVPARGRPSGLHTNCGSSKLVPRDCVAPISFTLAAYCAL